MNILFTLNPKVSTALAVLIGYALIDDLNAQEQNDLGNWIMLIAQLIITNATSQQLIESYAVSGKDHFNINSQKVKECYSPLFYDIDTLKEIMKNMYPEDREKLINEMHDKLSKIENILNDVHGK